MDGNSTGGQPFSPAPLDVEDDDDGFFTDDAMSIDGQMSNYSKSLTSSVENYPEEYGRRYHAYRPGSYPLPNDKEESSRLDLTHTLMVRLLGNRYFMAPLDRKKVTTILDIGTGTGIWAIDMGDYMPHSQITGIDISPTQHTWLPPNVRFVVDDVESPWVESRKYDFIMCRYMAASIRDWPALVQNIYDHLTPGGWAEFQDMDIELYSEDGTLTEQHATRQWSKTFVTTLSAMGLDPAPGPKLEGWVRGHGGFANVAHGLFKAPIGTWPASEFYRDIGDLNMYQTIEGLEGFSLRMFCGVLGHSHEQVMDQIAQVKQELRRDDIHCQFDIHVVFGQKPFGSV